MLGIGSLLNLGERLPSQEVILTVIYSLKLQYNVSVVIF